LLPETPVPNASVAPGRGAVPPAADTAAGRGGRGGGRGAAAPMQGGFFSSDTALWGRGWYFEHITVDPRDADIVYVPNVAVSRTKDGGKTWVALRGSP